MENKLLVRIEEHAGERVASFSVNCRGPEGAAWARMREWATVNLGDWPARRYIGCAPKGHHLKGEAHSPDEEEGEHEYLAQMFLYGHEGDGGSFLGADVLDAPAGLYLVGDVALNEFHGDGTVDIGSSMQKSAGVMFECLTEMEGYGLDLQARPHYEEHIFTKEWAQGDAGLAGFRLWLPVRKI